MEEKINEFVAKEGTPTDKEMREITQQWYAYIAKTDVIRALSCKKDFMMGMIIMAKRLTKT